MIVKNWESKPKDQYKQIIPGLISGHEAYSEKLVIQRLS